MADINTKLWIAAANGDVGTIQGLIADGVDVMAMNDHGWTALHYAAWRDQANAVRVLIDAEAGLEAKTNAGWVPLHFAAWEVGGKAVQVLIDAGADIEARDEDDFTPLHFAAWDDEATGARAAIKAEAGIEIEERTSGHMKGRREATTSITPNDEINGSTAVSKRKSRKKHYKKSIAADLEVGARIGDSRYGIFIAMSGSFKASSKNGGSSLSCFLQSLWKIMKYWTQHNSVPQPEGQETHEKSTLILIGAGADIGARARYGWTPLHRAAWEDKGEVVAALINAGAEIDARAMSDFTPLHFAAWKGKANAGRVLIDAKANLEVTDNAGRTPLTLAKAENQSELVEMLIGAGAKI